MAQHIDTELINFVAKALKGLNEKVVFVGGATVSLYADLPVSEIRPTDDIDVAVEIMSYAQRIELESRLKAIGFSHDINSGLTCRYIIGEEIIVDIIPTNDPSSGFNSRWYPEGFKNSIPYEDNPISINIFPAPYFIAVKLEAFKDRGNKVGRTSQDFEDIVFILENRTTVWDEIKNSDKEVKLYLIDEFKNLLKNPALFEWVDGHVERFSPPATYEIIERMKELTNIKGD